MAMKAATEYSHGLYYKLHMFGIPVTKPAFTYGDNQSVLANTIKPESTLKKKSNATVYHFVHKGRVKDEWRTTYINAHLNLAD
eukprot:11818713-Ditylum_brightwellii.AAC.1